MRVSLIVFLLSFFSVFSFAQESEIGLELEYTLANSISYIYTTEDNIYFNFRYGKINHFYVDQLNFLLSPIWDWWNDSFSNLLDTVLPGTSVSSFVLGRDGIGKNGNYSVGLGTSLLNLSYSDLNTHLVNDILEISIDTDETKIVQATGKLNALLLELGYKQPFIGSYDLRCALSLYYISMIDIQIDSELTINDRISVGIEDYIQRYLEGFIVPLVSLAIHYKF